MTPVEDPRVLAAAHAMYRQAMRLERLPDEIAEHHWNLPPDFNSDRPYYCRLALQVLEAADAADSHLRVPKDWDLRIQDSRACGGVTPAGVKNYLNEHGWTCSEAGPLAEIWESPALAGMLVPLRPDAGDYGHRIYLLVADVALAERRGQLAVLADLREASRQADA